MADELAVDGTSDDVTELSEGSRRDFIGKLVTAGMLAATSLVASGAVAEEEEADERGVDIHKIEGTQHKDYQVLKIDGVAHKIPLYKEQVSVGYLKIENGFRLVLRGAGLGTAFRGAGLVDRDVDTDKATITIEFRA